MSILSRGLLWSAIERFGVVIVQLLIEIVLARLILPSDYGLLGMTALFISIGSVFIDSGFSKGLIQKLDRNERDYATMFYFNILVSLGIYLIFFLIAPLVSTFYEIDQLIIIIRVISINILILAFSLVYRTKLTVELDFKTQAMISLISVIISGLIGIFLACAGFGIWALIAQTTLFNLFTLFLFIIKAKGFVPSYKLISRKSFNLLWKFGSDMTLASIVQAIYQNASSVLIGKFYSARILGIYTKSNQFTLMPANLITTIVSRVAYPLFSERQNSDRLLNYLNTKCTKYLCVFVFPIFIGFSFLSEFFVSVLLTDAWTDSIPIISILSFAYIFYPFSVMNILFFQVKARTGQIVKMELIVKCISIILLLFSLKYGLYIMCFSLLVSQAFQYIYTNKMTAKLLRGSQLANLFIFLKFLFISLAVSYISYLGIKGLNLPHIYSLVLGATFIFMLHFLVFVSIDKDIRRQIVRFLK